MYDCPTHATRMIQIQIERLLMFAASDAINTKIHVLIYIYKYTYNILYDDKYYSY